MRFLLYDNILINKPEKHEIIFPLGVATYRSANDIPEELRKASPNEEQLKGLLER